MEAIPQHGNKLGGAVRMLVDLIDLLRPANDPWWTLKKKTHNQWVHPSQTTCFTTTCDVRPSGTLNVIQLVTEIRTHWKPSGRRSHYLLTCVAIMQCNSSARAGNMDKPRTRTNPQMRGRGLTTSDLAHDLRPASAICSEDDTMLALSTIAYI